jgi:hypothetical protein
MLSTETKHVYRPVSYLNRTGEIKLFDRTQLKAKIEVEITPIPVGFYCIQKDSRGNIIDLCNAKGDGTGTRVEIILPLMTIFGSFAFFIQSSRGINHIYS